MPAPIDPSVRQAIVAAIRTGGRSRASIAREHGVSPGTVTNVARDAGLTDAFDRTKAKKACEAAQADAKALRARLALDLLHDAQRFRERSWTREEVELSSDNGSRTVVKQLPDLRAQQSGYTALAICIDKAAVLAREDRPDASEGARSLLGDLAIGLQAAYDALPPEGASPE